MNIYLIGFPGSGKTTIAKKLASRLNMDFIDLDRFVEEQSGTSIPDIFEGQGEDMFRKFERNCLRVISQKNNQMVATGGGTPCYFDNMTVINSSGFSVYLKMSVDTLFSRLKQAQTPRPLIQGMGDDQLRDFISDKLMEREPFYSKALYKVKAKDLDIEELAEFLKKEIAQ
jgi:shikimate kinase